MGKKIVAILLIATMAMGIAACGGSGDKKDDNTITVWCWDKTFNIFAMEEAAKIYQEDHQDVKIDIVEVGDVDVQSRLTTAGTSGDLSTLPDIFLMQDHAFQKNVISYPDVFTEISEKKIGFSEFASGKTDFSVVDENTMECLLQRSSNCLLSYRYFARSWNDFRRFYRYYLG